MAKDRNRGKDKGGRKKKKKVRKKK